MVWNWLRRHPILVDAAIVVALGAVYVGRVVHFHRPAGLVLAIAEVAPLLLRRRHPLAVLAIVTAATLADGIAYSTQVPAAAVVAIYTVAAHVPRSRSLVAGVAATGAVSLTALAVDGYHAAIPTFVACAAAWIAGDNLGTRRAYTRALEERAERLEREREAEAARAVAEEQARIARELHDVIAHSLSVIVVQAAAANDVFDARPDRARGALGEIEATGRVALAELRRLLGAVRGGETDFAPQPGVDRLDELVSQVRAAGLQVTVSVEGDALPLPAGIDLSVYRIVQEALTNTLKHADATRADIALRFRPGVLDLEVRDDGRGNGDGDGTGSGLIGMRERVSVYGGSLDAGPAPNGGFAVAARFPLEGLE